MAICPNCGRYYSSSECPECGKKLETPALKTPVPKHVSTQQYLKNNIGNVVQKLAGIDLAIGALATIICAIAFGRDSFGWYVLILLIGFITSAIAFIMLYAFGRLVESSIQTAENTNASLKYLEQIAQAQEKDIADNK